MVVKQNLRQTCNLMYKVTYAALVIVHFTVSESYFLILFYYSCTVDVSRSNILL